jgi:hypothetical protein
MKKTNGLIALTIASVLPYAASVAWATQEAVNGYYDSKNDWIVFEWVNPQTGKQQTVLDSASKVKPVMHANVSFNASTGVYTYSFEVTNLTGAVQSLDNISIQHSTDVFSATSPAPQNDWYSTEYQGKGAWSWSKVGGVGIAAGQTARGLSFQSKGVPAIVDAWFNGKRRSKFHFPSPDNDTEEVQVSFNRVYNNLKAQYPNKFVNAVHQQTIGPVNPPANFDASVTIQSLISFTNQSRAVGWIDDNGILTSLLAKLNSAKTKLASGDNKTAKNEIGAFLSDVQAQNGKHLTSEAYALLYFNGKFLVDHL